MTFTNEGTWDRVFRVLAGILLGYAAWMTWPGTLAIVSLVIAVVALVTGLVGWCAAYALFGFSTRKKLAT
jgi:hypothetical protein